MSALLAVDSGSVEPAAGVVIAGLCVIALAAVAVVRRVDVRLALSLAALALGALAGKLPTVVQTFLATLSREQFVLPICSAMGFAYVLRQTGCDQHLVQLLVEPVRRVRPLLVPGTVVIGFLVNIPIVSQTSTAATVGPVMIPLLRAAGLSSVTAGAALLLGASLGGELLNPGAPEFRTVSTRLDINAADCVRAIAPLLFLHLGVATLLFWWWNARLERRANGERKPADAKIGDNDLSAEQEVSAEPFKVNPLKALIPLVPLALLFLTGPPLELLKVDRSWLMEESEPDRVMGSRLVGLAMLIGVVVATLVSWRTAGGVVRAFFDGAGFAFTHIISLIVCAYAFGRGVEVVGLAELLGNVMKAVPGSLVPFAALLPLLFAFLSGSGFAATQSLFGFYVEPARALGVEPVGIGAVVSLSAAAGRTMSPVSAVALFCGQMTDTTAFTLANRVAPPLLGSLTIVLLLRSWLGW